MYGRYFYINTKGKNNKDVALLVKENMDMHIVFVTFELATENSLP